IERLENKLEQTIGGMEGAGKVLVMITLKDNGEKILDKNQPYESETVKSKEEGKETESSQIRSQQETVLVDEGGDTAPIVIQEIYPDVEGVVVVCEGGDNSELTIRIKEAVEALFSIDAHKIVVCKLQQ
ncbi:MAG: stage III sporulation protein AG, partial [Lachnospiraceae bacterium]|nr:stage III sporulation protein AG [Lachnospiraceae bacterium]